MCRAMRMDLRVVVVLPIEKDRLRRGEGHVDIGRP